MDEVRNLGADQEVGKRQVVDSEDAGGKRDRQEYHLSNGILELVTGLFLKQPAAIVGGIIHLFRFGLDFFEGQYVHQNGNRTRPPISKP